MILIKPSFEILNVNADLRLIEKAGRTCYKSEGNISVGSDEQFIESILRRGHESVIEHGTVTVKLTCDRGVTHEIVRHRLASYSQESTRYCNYKGGVTFIIPPWTEIIPGEYIERPWAYTLSPSDWEWFCSMLNAETVYIKLLEMKLTPQQARSVLPNSLKTELVMTANLREWRHFFKLRTSKAAHPQMRELAVPLLKEFAAISPAIFGGIQNE